MGTIRLYHSTTFSNLSNILKMGVMTTNNPHKEGHGNMLWFTTADDYGSQVRISIDVPQEDFDNGRFEFVNKIHVVTLKNVSIKEYNFKIGSINLIYLKSIGAYYSGFKGERLIRLANNEPHGAIEEMAFNGFYQEYANRDKNIQTILNYIRNKQTAINENKKMKKVIKINESQLRQIVRESLRKHLLNEGKVYGYSTYCPADRDLPFDYDNEMDSTIYNILYKDYNIRFSGNSWYSEPVNQYGSGDGIPEDAGIDDMKITDYDGFDEALKVLASIDANMANILERDFEKWVDETEIDWKDNESWE